VSAQTRRISADKIFMASFSVASAIRRFDAFPRNPWITAWSPRFFNAFNNRFT
jgi:hypothetical protein